MGIENLSGTGNELANTLTGNAGNNILEGGAGNDTLIGGGGNDTFVFNSINDGDDMILDFVLTEDTVDMDALLDALGAATVDRAGDVKIDTTTSPGDSILTIDGVADFSITFEGVTLFESDAAGLLLQGIDVGTL